MRTSVKEESGERSRSHPILTFDPYTRTVACMCTSTHVYIPTNMYIHIYTVALHIRLKLFEEAWLITTQMGAGLSG